MMGILLSWSLACGTAGSSLPPEVRPVDLDPGTAVRTGGEVFERWVRSGFVRMSPPVHLPQPTSGEVAVWLRLPEPGALGMIEAPDGRRVLSYPPGTVADRVETHGSGVHERVVDVRGTRIDEDGRRWHHVYRALPDRDAPLVGMEWPADEPELHALAVDAFLERLADGGADRHLDKVRAKLDCDGCHGVLRSENRTIDEHGLVARGTDAAGWFTPSTVLDADGVVERYGQWDPNLSDPFLAIRCPSGPAEVPAPANGRHASCPDGAVPRAALDLAAGLAAGDAHASEVCASWRALAERLGEIPSDHPCAEETP